MIIAGAGGFAKEVLELFIQKNKTSNLAFYVNVQIGHTKMFDKFPVLQTEKELQEFFKTNGNEFVNAIGNPSKRKSFSEHLKNLGGQEVSIVGDHAEIGSQDVNIGNGTVILGGARISNSVHVGASNIIYYNVVITHDCRVGDFVEIGPSANLLGNVVVGDLTQIGANATILPNIRIGKNAIIGAGAVVTKDVEDHAVVVGTPARVLKKDL